MNYRVVKNLIIEYLQLGLAILLASIGLKAFLIPNGFLDGGATGISILLSSVFDLDISLLLLVISIPFLLIGVFTVSKRIIVKSIFCIFGLAISIHYETFNTITDDKLLIAIFGGLFLGAGIGMAIRNGAVLDGSELLGIFLNDRFGIGIGRVILIFNVILFSLTTLILSMETAMYSILTYIVTAKVVDFFIEGFEDFIGITIISKKHELIERSIVRKIGAGITVFKGESGYGSSGKMEDFRIIQTIVNRIDIRKCYALVDQIDRNAFIVEFDVNSIKGGVLRRYLSRKKGKKLSADLG